MDSSTYKAPNAVGKKDAGTVEDVSRDLNAIKAALADIEDAEATVLVFQVQHIQ